jgi:hypothetical protein
LLLPWEPLGYYQDEKGQKFPLKQLQFRAEVAILPGIYDADLDWILWKVNETLGYVPLVPGRFFDPGSWRSISDQEMRDPIVAPKVAHAERELEASQH